MTVFMVTHDIGEAFKLGTRILTFDRVRRHPQAPDAFGASITYDLKGYNQGAAAAMATRHERRRCRPSDPDDPAGQPPLPPSQLREAQQPRLEGDRGRGQAVGEGWRKEQQWALDMGLPGAEA